MTINKNETAVDETADKNVLQNSVSTTSAADLNNPSTQPPDVSKEKLRDAAEQSAKLDSPERTNDSTIDPNKPKEKILEGFHGG
jgi:hypothetical protein